MPIFRLERAMSVGWQEDLQSDLLLTGSSAPRRWADATIAIMGLRYPINHQTAVLLDCLVVIDGPCRGARLGIEVVMLNP
jgi:hypothetical protein